MKKKPLASTYVDDPFQDTLLNFNCTCAFRLKTVRTDSDRRKDRTSYKQSTILDGRGVFTPRPGLWTVVRIDNYPKSNRFFLRASRRSIDSFYLMQTDR